MSFLFTIQREDTFAHVTFEGSLLSKEQAQEFLNELDFLISENLVNVILDLSKMTYMNSTGLSILINVLTQCRNKGGDVIIINVPSIIEKLLIVTKLNSVFTIAKSVDEAKNIINKK
ncbi:STAS domain-containing protein [bacterium]|nr:STAS domain-containing protein [bacterium]